MTPVTDAPEFNLIDILKRNTSAGGTRGVDVGIGDDAAVLRPDPGTRLVSCVDTLVDGIHFPRTTDAADVGYKSLAVNLSDLAAMGARPRWALLSLSLPEAGEQWVRDFCAGWSDLAGPAGVALVGGDTTATDGPLTVSVQVLGELPEAGGLLRSGARPGDQIGVTGNLGGAALALAQLKAGKQPAAALRRRLDRPQPRLAAGGSLLSIASACIDLSDGLAADLQHVMTASGRCARVALDDLPLHPDLSGLGRQQQLDLALGGGDDYELCFCFPPQRGPALASAMRAAATAYQVIGEVVEGQGVQWSGGGDIQVPSGYAHFAGSRIQ